MQLNIAIEEFAELTKEICKHKRGADNTESIVEEIADCCKRWYCGQAYTFTYR